MHMIKIVIRDNAFECARFLACVGVELTGTPWIISNEVEVANAREKRMHLGPLQTTNQIKAGLRVIRWMSGR